MHTQGKLIIFSAPSGAGKSTIINHILENYPSLTFSISACSRAPREGEEDGVHYYFLGTEGFKEQIEQDAFVEWEEVYKDNFYGTLKSELTRIWGNQQTAVFDLDVVGGVNLKKKFGDQALSIFIKPPSIEVLEERLRSRGTETEEKIQMRIGKAAKELEYAKHFDCIVENDILERALTKTSYLIEDFISQKTQLS
ncbi:MAG: guanylate kinase [Flavobacteriales bacterium]|jgi:guanylate kinase|nr:guanylate kinase [Flavobacteriales bacterium]